MTIDPHAIIHPGARLDESVSVGAFSIIGPNVSIGAGTRIDSSVVIDGWTTIGKNCKIFPGTVIGTEPQDIKYGGERSYVEIGDNNVIREYVTVHRGTDPESKTVVGSNNYIMANCHLGHNSRVGNHVFLVNNVGLGGFVEIEDRAYVSAMMPIHQFIRIGSIALVALGTRLTLDVPPYLLIDGNPPKIYGLNVIGLKRAEWDDKKIGIIKKAYKLLSKSNLNISQALKKIEIEVDPIPEVKHFIEFIRASKRGIHR